jgi:ABC-type dipeptide/oligopeptide/nickel transport system ATPase component
MLLEIKNLSVNYFRGKKIIPAIQGASIQVTHGESVGLVGESGSGKSTIALAILRLIAPHEGRITQGEILFEGKDILSLSEGDIRKIRGQDIGIIFQDPFSSLNPVIKIGAQIEEAIEVHFKEKVSRQDLRERTLTALANVRLDEPERIYNSYPHQVSGGQRQRAMIAMAIANRPRLLIADEPTTALDVTVQKEILDLLSQLKKELGMAILLITHHLGIVPQTTSQLYVMQGGKIAESGATQKILRNPEHPYSQELLTAAAIYA